MLVTGVSDTSGFHLERLRRCPCPHFCLPHFCPMPDGEGRGSDHKLGDNFFYVIYITYNTNPFAYASAHPPPDG